MGHYISPDKVARIRQLIAQGLSMREVARQTGIKPNTVQRYHPKNAAAVDADYQRMLEGKSKPRGPYRKKSRERQP